MIKKSLPLKPTKPFAVDIVNVLINDAVLSATLKCNNLPLVVTDWSFDNNTTMSEKGGSDDGSTSGDDSSNDEDREKCWKDKVLVHSNGKTESSQTYDDDLHRGVKPAECKWIARFGNGPSQEERNRPTFHNSGFHYPRGATTCSDGSQRHGTCRCGQLVNSGKADRCGCSNAKCPVCTRTYRTFNTHAKKRRRRQNDE